MSDHEDAVPSAPVEPIEQADHDEALEPAPADVADVHASKISPDDPRLKLRRSGAGNLRKGPAVVALCAMALVLAVSIAVAVNAASAASKKPKSSESVDLVIPPVPESILKAASAVTPAPRARPAATPVLRLDEGPMLRREFANDNDEPDLTRGQKPERPRQIGGARSKYSDDALRERQLDAFYAARGAGVLADPGQMPHDVGGSEEQPGDGQPAGHDPDEPGSTNLDELTGANSVAPGAGALDDPNLQGRKNDFVRPAVRARDDGYLRSQLQRPRSPYEIKAGSILPATLITGINSDLPGPVIAQVRENVYDTVAGAHLLIPQGSRLLATYDSMVAWGQERVLLCWNRLVLPNGNSIHLECMPGADLTGAAGLTDEVDEHWWRIIKGAAVASLLSAATTAAAGSPQGYNPNVPQMWARGAASEIGNVGENITRRNIMIQPTITVRPGWSLNVMVTRDMILPPFSATEADDER